MPFVLMTDNASILMLLDLDFLSSLTRGRQKCILFLKISYTFFIHLGRIFKVEHNPDSIKHHKSLLEIAQVVE